MNPSTTLEKPVESGRVRGRRKLRFRSFDEVLSDAAQLARTPHVQLGNWSLGMMLKHLGNAMRASVAGGTFRVKWYLRVLGPWFVKPLLVKGPFPAGFRLPRRAAEILVPKEEVSYEEGLAAFHEGVAALSANPPHGAHPVAGKLSPEEWTQFHLRHAEMHLSFLVPRA